MLRVVFGVWLDDLRIAGLEVLAAGWLDVDDRLGSCARCGTVAVAERRLAAGVVLGSAHGGGEMFRVVNGCKARWMEVLFVCLAGSSAMQWRRMDTRM